MISIKNLYKKFDSKIIYEDLSIDIEEGEKLVIIGQSGVGKSVLLKHIVGLIKPDSGTVSIDGTDLGKIGVSALFRQRKKFGFVFQGGALFDSMSVAENVALPLREHTKMTFTGAMEKVSEKLEMVGLKGCENLETAELSGGMRKRVAIARAIIMEPAYILYDEPTTGLDPILAEHINELIVDLNARLNITSIVVTHDISSAYTIASRIAMLYQGKIIHSGSPQDTKKSNNPYLLQFLQGKSEGPIDTN
ncbi:ABC transporter ATP-binding protein [candidate division WOR-3 bacterium]|nr:ABC transporter ATP-binding protein [candidate division WOR-3 bacterium]